MPVTLASIMANSNNHPLPKLGIKSKMKVAVLKQKGSVPVPKPKPKRKKVTEDNDNNDDPTKQRGGRQKGAKGWTLSEANFLLDCVEKLQPTGKKALEELAKLYNTLAGENGFPVRTSYAMEHIYKKVCVSNVYTIY
jgi:hypothetical protein